jgi:hypothetical protein
MDFQLADGIAVLERTPAVLRSMLHGLPSSWSDATEGPDTWSPYTVVGHLIHGERADWITRAEIILAQGPNRRSCSTSLRRCGQPAWPPCAGGS